MKQTMRSFALALMMLLLGAGGLVSTLHAQDTPAPPADGQQQGAGGGRRGMDPGAHAARLQQQLGLTDDVTAKVKDIYTDGMSKIQALRQSGASRDDMRSKMMAIRADESTKVKALLTPDQATKYDQIEAQQRQRGAGGPPPQL
jgi:periplasmic protein CpxP/Spy